MSTQVQYRRGSNVQVAAFTGALGELVIDTTNKIVVVNDGATVGGFPQVGLTATQTITNKIYQGTSASVTGNVTGGNINTGGLVSATGNVTGNYLLGNAYFVSGLSPTQIYSGTSNVSVLSSSGNIAIGVGGTSNVAVFATTGEYVTGVVSASGNVTGGNITTAGQLVSSIATGTAPLVVTSVTLVSNLYASRANVSDYDIVTTATTGTYYPAFFNAVTGNVQNYANSNINVNAATGAFQATILSATGNITGGNLSVGTGNVTLGNIVNSGANLTGNIGSATTYFNTVFAKATSAQYADLAENYTADVEYTPGTVIEFGGTAEVTQTSSSHRTQVAGIVSTNPSYLMNAGQTGNHVVAVALTGRVPCQVVGNIVKGDRLVSSNVAGVATVLDMSQYQPGCIIGKALENYNSQEIGQIEIAVGRF
jgi:hypothetical protein